MIERRDARTEIDEEIMDHLARETERIAAEVGSTPGEARASALQRFGEVEHVRLECLSILRWRRWRRTQTQVACLLLGAGAVVAMWIGAQPRGQWRIQPTVTSIAIRQSADKCVESHLYRLKRHGSWEELFAASDDAMANRGLPAPTRAYAAMCQIEAGRALLRPEQKMWTRFESLHADLSERPDIEWLVRKLRAGRTGATPAKRRSSIDITATLLSLASVPGSRRGSDSTGLWRRRPCDSVG